MFRSRLFVCGAAVGLALYVKADRAEADPMSLEPRFTRDAAALNVGAMELYPALAAQTGYDSNIYESHRNVRDSYFSRVAPELSALLPFSAGAIQVLYQADQIRYTENSDDNFTDQLAMMRFRFSPNLRNRFSGDYSWNGKHEPRGTGLTEGFDPAIDNMDSGPDELTDRRAHFKYEFGAITAPGRLRFAMDALQRDYTNHRERTRYFDRDELGGGITFLWRVLPRTSILLEARARDIDYDTVQPSEASLDSREYNYLTGIEWEASEQTLAGVRLGRKTKNFSSPQREDASEFAWEINAKWTPNSYSIFEANFHRSPAETNGLGDFIDMRSYVLSWQCEWNQRLASKVSVNYDQAFYQSVNEDRDTRALQLQLNYQMRRWISWSISYDMRERSSDLDILSMERNRYVLGVEMTL